MDVNVIIASLAAKYPIITTVAAALGILVVVGQTYAPLRKYLEKVEALPVIGPILKGLAAFAPVQPKP